MNQSHIKKDGVIELHPPNFVKLDFVHLALGPSQGLRSKDDCSLKSAAVIAGVVGRCGARGPAGKRQVGQSHPLEQPCVGFSGDHIIWQPKNGIIIAANLHASS